MSEVKVRAVSGRDAGQYKCEARSVVGAAEIKASIRVVQRKYLLYVCLYGLLCMYQSIKPSMNRNKKLRIPLN